MAVQRVLSASKSKRFWRPLRLAAVLSSLLVVWVGSQVYQYQRSHKAQGTRIAQGVEPSSSGDTAILLRQRIEVPKPAYITSKERIVLRNPTAKAFDTAMAAYQRGDFASAIEQLETLSELETDNAADVKFYLGVSLLLMGWARDGIKPLIEAVELSTGPRRESSRYYLSLAYLKSDQMDQALTELDAVIAMAGEHQADAQALKHQIADIRK